ncbi:hypothetical protein EDB92DRAFT_1950686 [Lactarius akahatsu]|uniref:Uncharacterized protein n=1 Tax=Lactarius akahatsu TaxID=416441 RepID=A0AAD4Q4Z1_9AGAM|nr:hypothetical protein EDB92DRAFT_1950686 [Lactarius akahatsu]
MQNGQLYAQYTPMLTLDPAPAPGPRCDSTQTRVAPLVHLDIIANKSPTVTFTTITPALVHPRAPLHVSTLPQTYHEHLQRHHQQQHLQQHVHGFDPHAQHVIAHAQIAPAPPLPSSHPKTRLLIPAQLQTNPQQTQQQNMTHTPTTASMLIPATVPVHQSSSTEQTLVQIRAQPPAPAPPAGPPFPLAMQMVSTTRMREQVQTQAVPALVQAHTQQAAAVAGASLDATTSATTSASAGAGAGSSAVQSTPGPGPGTQTRGPPRTLQMPPPHVLSPVSARAQPTSSASNTPPSHQQQQHHQRFAVPPALAAFKVLQPAKELLEQTWAAAIAAVQQEFAAVHAELGRSAREKQALTELLQRLQGERMQALHALHSTQAELKQCMGNFQSERRTRVHLERRLAEMTQLIEKCTCGAASAKISPSTVTPPPLVVLDHAPPALPSSAPSPVPSSPASVPVLAQAAEARATTPPRTPTPASGSSPKTTTQSSSSPSPDAVRSSVRRHEREEDDAETVEGESATKRRRIERTPTPTSPSAPASEVVAADTREAPAPVDMAPTTQALREQPSPCKVAPPPQQQQPETPKTPAAAPRRKIGIQHIQLVYETKGSTLQCRMCLLRKREVDSTTHVATFPVSAAYPDLVGHCEQEHDAALEALAGMSPGEIAEMRQRFQAAQSPQ